MSQRTINRDIEDICMAGILIVTTQGSGGGIGMMDGFNLDTTVFTEDEMSAILTGLKTLDSVSYSSSADKLARKIGGESAVTLSDNMMIDLSSFYKDDLASKIEQIKSAIRERRCIIFHYYYKKGEANKCIEPYLIVFKWSDWYVFEFCTLRQDFRMYKVRRLWELTVTNETYKPREIPEEKKQFGAHMMDGYFIMAIYGPSVKYRLVEEYGPNSFTVMDDGRLHTKWGFTDPDETVLWFLGFGDKVEVIEPPEMREKMKTEIGKIARKYEDK